MLDLKPNILNLTIYMIISVRMNRINRDENLSTLQINGGYYFSSLAALNKIRELSYFDNKFYSCPKQ
jgi:hypothetical protein